MYRTTNCGSLRLADAAKKVELAGWVQRVRTMGSLVFVDLRDRYGLTQLTANKETDAQLTARLEDLGREYVISVKGTVVERSAKNNNIPTGEIEIHVQELQVLNAAATPPFTIEEQTDGGDELRMKYRYLDLRRKCVRQNLELRHRFCLETRKYLDKTGFLEIETPVLIKSTPEGARDFVVPSRMNPTEFYALPQSPQTFKQLLMVSGMDKYFQIVKCFRDEDLRADRQPEFTQIDCEMSFVCQEDVLQTFEGLSKHLFKTLLDIEQREDYPRISWEEAMSRYGSDKPDTRFAAEIVELHDLLKGQGFKVFDDAPHIAAILIKGAAEISRKELDSLTDYVKRPQIGAKGMVYAKVLEDNTIKSSVDKFFSQEILQQLRDSMQGETGDLILILSGEERYKNLERLGLLRLEAARRYGLIPKDTFSCLWVTDFPLLEWDEETKRFYAKHHPFTSPREEDIPLLETDPGKVRANAYDMVINGVEVGGGSIRIHDSILQQKMFKILGFTEEEAMRQFGFLIEAFKYGAPPHGGIAYGLDRWVSLFAGLSSIRDVIAFPKNNAGRDVMIDAPDQISKEQLEELHLDLRPIQKTEK